MFINAVKLREMLHDLKEILGQLVNASEEKMREATDKIEEIFEHTPAPIVAGEVQPEVVAPVSVVIGEVPPAKVVPVSTTEPTTTVANTDGA